MMRRKPMGTRTTTHNNLMMVELDKRQCRPERIERQQESQRKWSKEILEQIQISSSA
jgi:hypothetical protein